MLLNMIKTFNIDTSIMNMDDEFLIMAQKEKKNEICIATEIYLARKFVKLRYEELMGEHFGLVTSRSLVNWLEDHHTGRKGLLSYYFESGKEDFDDGIWNAAYLPKLVLYIKNISLREDIVSNKKKRNEFERSFANEKWVLDASTIIGLKMLEKLYHINSLKTDYANHIVGQNLRLRNLIDGQAKLNARQMKTHNYRIDDLRGNIESIFREEQNKMFQLLDKTQTEEYNIFKKNTQYIENNILRIPKIISKELTK